MSLNQTIKKLKRLLGLHEQELQAIKAELLAIDHRYDLASRRIEACELEIATTLQQFSEGTAMLMLYGQMGNSLMIQLGVQREKAIQLQRQIVEERESWRSALSEKHRRIESLKRYLDQKQIEFDSELTRQENLDMTDRFLGIKYLQGDEK